MRNFSFSLVLVFFITITITGCGQPNKPQPINSKPLPSATEEISPQKFFLDDSDKKDFRRDYGDMKWKITRIIKIVDWCKKIEKVPIELKEKLEYTKKTALRASDRLDFLMQKIMENWKNFSIVPEGQQLYQGLSSNFYIMDYRIDRLFEQTEQLIKTAPF